MMASEGALPTQAARKQSRFVAALILPLLWIKNKFRLLSKRPIWVAIVLILMSLAIALGVWGVVAASNAESDSRKATATNVANQKAINVKGVINSAFNPIITIATLVRRDPKNWTRLNETFYQVANEVFLQSGVVFNVQLVPNAIIMSVVPITGFQGTVSLDLLQSLNFRGDTLKAIITNTTTMSGPSKLQIGIYGLAGRLPIFVPNVDAYESFGFHEVLQGPPGWGLNLNGTYNAGTFNRDIYSPTGGNCPVAACYKNETREKLWGLADIIIGWERAKDLAGLYDLCNQYDFLMTNVNYTNATNAIAQCADKRNIPTNLPASTGGNITTAIFGPYTLADYLPRAPVQVKIQALNNEWTLWVVDNRGWTPAYRDGLIAGVVVASVVLAVMVLLLLASHLEQDELLEESAAAHMRLEETKATLEAEKVHADALVARQLNLINCFSESAYESNGSTAKPPLMGDNSTLERIEAVRRSLNVGQDEGEVQVISLLGSGSFGKVYRGFWRGTEVAIKTIVLPSDMNANAKREKMAIMEAAISSSLLHPNITQVFTYSFRPIKDTIALAAKGELVGSNLLQVAPIDSTFMSSIASTKGPDNNNNSNISSNNENSSQVFSFEVRLVMEYCDLGCLREALDSGVFGAGTGSFNYSAVLDTLLDVAKAMNHLHKSNVLHMDLKARNIMLKSDGSDPRGMVAKVADFGLSVSLDSSQTHMSSMFQGTITHMAPEILMKGHVSKAADVYAFGITMFEVYTGKAAYCDIPAPHIGHSITAGKCRPVFPESTPMEFQELAASCWVEDPEPRPSFASVLGKLQELRANLPKISPPIDLALLPKSPTTNVAEKI